MQVRQWMLNSCTKNTAMASTATLTAFLGEMAYTKSGGAGLPLFFLHGTGCDSEDWVSVIEKLPHNQRHITIDFCGHGKSNTPNEPFTLAGLTH